jgi:hypothetical protein
MSPRPVSGGDRADTEASALLESQENEQETRNGWKPASRCRQKPPKVVVIYIESRRPTCANSPPSGRTSLCKSMYGMEIIQMNTYYVWVSIPSPHGKMVLFLSNFFYAFLVFPWGSGVQLPLAFCLLGFVCILMSNQGLEFIM